MQPPKLATYDDLLARTEDDRAEILDGVVVLPPSPLPRHNRAQSVWICEVTSPSNAAHDRVRKRRLYARHGVAYYWLLDPLERTLEALRLDVEAKTWVELGSYDDDSAARIAPFDAIEISVGKFFPPLPPAPPP